nr:MAG TPA: hypothetical protein [Caudoviricetes sp.]
MWSANKTRESCKKLAKNLEKSVDKLHNSCYNT